MTDFIKWAKIKNTSQQSNMERFVNFYPELMQETYVVTEKIHGANIQLCVNPLGEIRWGSRNQWIANEFFNVQLSDLEDRYAEVIDILKELADTTQTDVRLYGELFGGNIQKGINYGNDKRVLFFGLCIGQTLQPFAVLVEMIPEEYIVPVLVWEGSFEFAMNVNTKFDTRLNNIGDNETEGVVIQPLYRVYTNEHGDPFIVKSKNDWITERKVPREKIRMLDGDLQEAKTLFDSYVTKERLNSVISQNGPLTEMKQIGEYIKLTIQDAKEDFLDENPTALDKIGKSKHRFVYNSSKKVAKWCKEIILG